ncbi:hypothetical protein [Comamonas sp. HJ-2]
MKQTTFEKIAKRLRMQPDSPSYKALCLVVVHGMSQQDAFKATGCAQPNISRQYRAFMDAIDDWRTILAELDNPKD